MQTDFASRQVLETEFPISSLLKTALRQNSILFMLVAGYFTAAILISAVTSDPFLSGNVTNIFWMVVALIPTFFLTMIVWRFTHMVVTVRPTKPIGWLCHDLWATIVTDKLRSFSGGIAILLVIIFSFAFAYVKEAIPLLNPYDWDPTFAEWDRLLHGGVDAYVAMTPLFGSPCNDPYRGFRLFRGFLLVYFFMFLPAWIRKT